MKAGIPPEMVRLSVGIEDPTDLVADLEAALNVPKPDMNGSREQGTWVRYQQVACVGPNGAPPCQRHGWPMYWDSMAYARFPG